MNPHTASLDEIDRILLKDAEELALLHLERVRFEQDPAAYLRGIRRLREDNRRMERELYPDFGMKFFSSRFIPAGQMYLIRGITP